MWNSFEVEVSENREKTFFSYVIPYKHHWKGMSSKFPLLLLINHNALPELSIRKKNRQSCACPSSSMIKRENEKKWASLLHHNPILTSKLNLLKRPIIIIWEGTKEKNHFKLILLIACSLKCHYVYFNL